MLLLLFFATLILIYNGLSRKLWIWISLIGSEVFFCIYSAFRCSYYSGLPGSGKAPGLTHLGDVLIHLLSCIGFAVLLIITGLVWFLTRRKNKNRA